MRCGSRDSSPGLGGRSRRENSCELHDQRVSEGDVLHVTITSATCANGLPGRFPASVSHGYDDYLRWSPRLVRSDLLEAWVGVTLRCWQLERKLPALTLQFKPLTSSSGSSILRFTATSGPSSSGSRIAGDRMRSPQAEFQGANRGRHTRKCDPRGKPDPHNHADLAL